MSKLNEGEVLTKLTGMLNDSYMQGYQDALNIKTKLSIPKKVAELADKYVDKYGFSQIDKDEALELTVAIDSPEKGVEAELIYDYADKNPALLTAYLASKALGVELVEVEE